MELETAARRQLLGVPAVTGYVQQKVFKYRLEEMIDSTGGRAVVVRRSGQWSTPDPVQTSEYPVLTVDCYADPTRTPEGEIDQLDAEDKAFAVFRTIDPVFHARRNERWGAFGSAAGLLVVSSARWREPSLVGDQPGEDELGDVVIVRAQYAVHCVHETAAV